MRTESRDHCEIQTLGLVTRRKRNKRTRKAPYKTVFRTDESTEDLGPQLPDL